MSKYYAISMLSNQKNVDVFISGDTSCAILQLFHRTQLKGHQALTFSQKTIDFRVITLHYFTIHTFLSQLKLAYDEISFRLSGLTETKLMMILFSVFRIAKQ